MTQRVAARIISVGGGKGGVGKSVVAANLAVAMAQEGREVVLVDADLGAANLHTLFGLEGPGPTLQSFIDHEVDSLESARVATGQRGLWVVRGASAVVGAANINHGQKVRLLRHVEKLAAEVVVVDVGAGSAFNQLDLFDVADLKVLVATPQLTSLQNAYGFVKGAVFRALVQVARAHEAQALLEAVGAQETARVAPLLAAARAHSEPLAQALAACLHGFGAQLFGNQVLEPGEGRVFASVARMMRDFLGLEVPILGCARASRLVHESINRRRPFLLEARQEEAAAAIRSAARALLAAPLSREARPERAEALVA